LIILNKARILAKTFYAEMSKAEFGPDHMLITATEIISLLSYKVKLHKERLKKIDSWKKY
jgi:hypothetical protein